MMEIVGGDLAAFANVIHITGPGKMTDRLGSFGQNYVAVELLTNDMREAVAAADAVVCRAGMGTITELAARRKPAVVIPLPRSPQEANARALEEVGAAVVLRQGAVTPQELFEAIRGILVRDDRRDALSAAMNSVLRTDVASEIVSRLLTLK